MEEYEVDLRDYFRVMWRKKWVILGVFLASIAVSLGLSFMMPNQYEAAATCQLDLAPSVTGAELDSISTELAITMLRSPNLLQQAAKQSPAIGDTEGALSTFFAKGLRVNKRNGHLFNLELRGPLSPDLLQEVLARLIELYSARVKDQLRGEIEEELLRMGNKVERLELEEKRLAEEIDEVLTQEGNAQLKVGEFEATLKGYAFRLELSNLYERMALVQQELDDLRLTQEELRKLADQGWEPVTTISPPYASTTPVSPNRRMNVAVAGVLGLFVGILLAFFIHYVEGGKEVEREKE